jgi:hypothetical protein
MSTTKTPKKAHPLWTIGILAIVAAATVLLLLMTSGH